jgi:hypothetical protein
MKKLLLLLLIPLLAHAQAGVTAVTAVTSTGVLNTPSNFWTANSAAISSAIGGTGNVTTAGSAVSGQTAQFNGSTSITGVNNTGTGNYVLATSPTITTPTLSGHVAVSGGGSPTVALGPVSSGSASISITGTDSAFVVTIVTGSTPPIFNTDVWFTVTFATAFTSTPRSWEVCGSTNAAASTIGTGVGLWSSTTATTYVMHVAPGGLGGGQTLIFKGFCLQ